MAFPPAAYTTRGGVATVKAAALVEASRPSDPDPDPAALPEDEQKLAA